MKNVFYISGIILNSVINNDKSYDFYFDFNNESEIKAASQRVLQESISITEVTYCDKQL